MMSSQRDGDSEMDDILTPCSARDSCRTYFLTYSKANMELVENVNKFSEIVLEGFRQGKSQSQVVQWAVCQEHRVDDTPHYHMESYS